MREEPMDYAVHFEVPGHEYDGLFYSLEEAQSFAANYVVVNKLRARDVLVSDSLANWRGWNAISRKNRKLMDPWFLVSAHSAGRLDCYLRTVHKIDIRQLKIVHDGKITVHDPRSARADRRRVLGTVDAMLRDFKMRKNAEIARADDSLTSTEMLPITR